jgi:hypothetical protein
MRIITPTILLLLLALIGAGCRVQYNTTPASTPEPIKESPEPVIVASQENSEENSDNIQVNNDGNSAAMNMNQNGNGNISTTIMNNGKTITIFGGGSVTSKDGNITINGPSFSTQSFNSFSGNGDKNFITGAGEPVADARQLANFRNITATSAFEVEVVCGKEQHVVVIAQKNILPLIRTEVKNGTLVFRVVGSYKTNKPIKIQVQMSQLETLRVGSSASVSVEGLNTPHFTAYLSGAGSATIAGEAQTATIDVESSANFNGANLTLGPTEFTGSGAGEAVLGSIHGDSIFKLQSSADLKVGEINATRITANLSGASQATFVGNCTESHFTVESSAELTASDLKTARTTIDASGSSKAHVFASENLKAEAQSSAEIYYRGGAGVVKTHSSGNGSIESE